MRREGSAGANPGAHGWRGEVERRYPVLRALSPELARELHRNSRAVEVPAGTTAFDVDSPCEGLTLITRGAVRVFRSGPQGREILLYRVRPGESCILSVGCLLGRSAYPATGVVESDLAGVVVPRDLFERLVAETPAFRTWVFELFAARVSTLLQLVEEVAFHRLDRRIAAFLARRARETGSTEIGMTHQELADQVGSVREIVSRALESLESRGAVSLGRGRITLVRPSALRELAGDLAAEPADGEGPSSSPQSP